MYILYFRSVYFIYPLKCMIELVIIIIATTIIIKENLAFVVDYHGTQVRYSLKSL